MTAPADDSVPDANEGKPVEYRGVLIERSPAGRIGTPPGRPLYLYSCLIYGRRLARTSLAELQRSIDEALDG